MKGRQRESARVSGCLCMICERKRERGTEWVGVYVAYVKGRDIWTARVCVCSLCERKRDRV